MRTAVAQPSAVYPLPTRASRAWQLMHLAAAISLPLPSGRFWLKAGTAEHSKAAAIKDRRDFLDMGSPLGNWTRPARFSAGEGTAIADGSPEGPARGV